MDTFPGFFYAQADTLVSDILLCHIQDLAQILIGETVLLRLCEGFVCRKAAGSGGKRLFFFD